MHARSEVYRRRREQEQQRIAGAAPWSAAAFFLAARAADDAPHNAAAHSHAAAAFAIPAYVGISHVPAGISKMHAHAAASASAAAHSATHSPAAPAAAAAAAPVFLPHMDDLDEEIQAMGFEKAMVAGAAAGVTEHVFMFPVDTVKTRMQALQTAGEFRSQCAGGSQATEAAVASGVN